MPTSRPSLIDATHATFMQSGVSISLGSCDTASEPWVGKAIGCEVAPDYSSITVFTAASHAPELLMAIRQSGRIAVVFSQPSTHRTLQLKGMDARIARAEAKDRDIADAYREAFIQELRPLGFDERPIRAVLACEPEDLIRITFSPCAAFTQTPGPHAGKPLDVEK